MPTWWVPKVKVCCVALPYIWVRHIVIWSEHTTDADKVCNYKAHSIHKRPGYNKYCKQEWGCFLYKTGGLYQLVSYMRLSCCLGGACEKDYFSSLRVYLRSGKTGNKTTIKHIKSDKSLNKIRKCNYSCWFKITEIDSRRRHGRFSLSNLRPGCTGLYGIKRTQLNKPGCACRIRK